MLLFKKRIGLGGSLLRVSESLCEFLIHEASLS